MSKDATSAEASGATEPVRRRRSTEDVRRQIMEAARSLFAEKGYAGTTTRDISRRSKASEALIFRYYQSKANLFHEVIVEPFEERLQQFLVTHSSQEASSIEDSRQFVDGLFKLLREDAESLRALLTTRLYDVEAVRPERGSRTFQLYFREAVARMEDELSRRDVKPAVDIRLSTRFGFAAVVATALFGDWFFADSGHEDADLISALTEYIALGMTTPAPVSSPVTS